MDFIFIINPDLNNNMLKLGIHFSKNMHTQHSTEDTLLSALNLQNPQNWIRLRRFTTDGLNYHDYAALNSDLSARIRTENGKIKDIALMPHTVLHDIYLQEVYTSGRPWNAQGQTTLTTDLKSHEFIFGIAPDQKEQTTCVLITPAIYFERTGKLWEGSVDLSNQLPNSIKNVAYGTYESTTLTFSEIKQELIKRGFIEADPLSLYHSDILEMAQIQTNESEHPVGLDLID